MPLDPEAQAAQDLEERDAYVTPEGGTILSPVSVNMTGFVINISYSKKSNLCYANLSCRYVRHGLLKIS